MPIALALVLHAHQPAGNFDGVIEAAYQSSYRPFVESAAARPWLRLGLHYSGFLLDWLARRHPEYIELLRMLAARKQIEILGGGYYEPILAVIPPADQQEQLALLAEAIERHFGARPRGAWLAERVWEPELPAALAAAGVQYTLLDDTHFQMAGLAETDLHGYWITESQGARLKVVPSNFFLRQTIPFRPESESIEYLLEAGQRRDGLLTMGDDLEKFGSWPHTHRHVYVEGWLERFWDGLEARREEIETVRLGDYLERNPPRGLVYLPTASYPEMMKWAGSPCWRGFFTKYREANLLHKTLWDLDRRLRACPLGPAARAEARQHLLAAECNDVYWHGWFGGLYSPHLRNLAFTHLLAADAQIEAWAGSPALRRLDLHADGRETIEMRTPELRLLLAPGDGGTIEELDFRPANANLINSIQRRPEAYHDELRRKIANNPAQLPGGAEQPNANWEERLLYDPYPCSGGRLYLCPPGKAFPDFQHLGLGAELGPAGGAYTVAGAVPGEVTLAYRAMRKTYRVERHRVELAMDIGPGVNFAVLEMVWNLLAADADDRYFEQAGRRYSLHWAGELGPDPLELWDGWRRLRIHMGAPGARAWWVQPIYTVSQADTGLESLYQGSAFAAVWPPEARKFSLDTKIFL